MAKIYYKEKKRSFRKLFKLLSGVIFILGITVLIYVFLPLISWQIYFAPVFASQAVAIPIPKASVVEKSAIVSLLDNASSNLSIDYTNASNWYPNQTSSNWVASVPTYTITIPAININNAVVSTTDSDLASHLVEYNTGTIPPMKGNSIVFGHSTLPQLYDPKNYKTVFANSYKLKVGDEILVNVNNKTYKYSIKSIIVVDPEDTSVLAQDFSDSYLTLITCTPPGTVWKRLVIKSKLEE